MPLQIIQHTPLWVFAVFAVLLWLGVNALSTRTASLPRVLGPGLALAGLSVYGAIAGFGASALALTAWALAALAVFVWAVRRPLPRGTRYDSWQRVFTLPGSWQPLALMMGIFGTKYAVGVALALQPALAMQWGFSVPVAALYGVFTGLFVSKSLRLWQLSLRGDRLGGALTL
ncbi:MAG: hypothetical protein KA795_17335 [Burkholderiaceae bacterium]|nr:hypothetical protein [Burkholderiaceae bacterium]